MKVKQTTIVAAWTAAILGINLLQAQIHDEVKDKVKNPGEAKVDIKIDGDHAHADAKVDAGAKGDGAVTKSHSESKSVSVTSDGHQTVRKTVTTRNGVTEEKTEVLDAGGNVIEEKGDQPPQQRDQAKPTGVWIGAEVQAADPALREQLGLGEEEGVVIRTIAKDGPAAKAGLKVNDILLKAGDQVLAEDEDLRSELRNHKAGDSLEIAYMRKGERGTLTVTVEQRNNQQQNQGGGAKAQGDQDGNSIHLEIDGASNLDDVINDPNVPEAIKKQMKEILERMKQMQK